MSDQQQESTEVKSTSENVDDKQTTESNESIEKSSPEENKTSDEQEQPPARRLVMPQDIRYATEQGDRDKLLEKYNNYQVSETNSCIIRFVTDHRQKKNLLGRNEEENSNLHSLAKTFDVNLHMGYQNLTKHSFKISATEANVRKCLIEMIHRMFKYQHRSPTVQGENESNNNPSAVTTDAEKNEETTEVSTDKSDDKSPPHPTTIFVTTINPDSSITEEQKPITPSTPNPNEEKTDAKDESIEEEQYKFVPLERKPEYTLIILITSQGQEVLKKNWSFFAGSLQQRLNVTVTNPFKLPKFGDKQWQNELSITGQSHENITDAALQITAFINDVLGVPNQPHRADEEQTNNDHTNFPRTKSNNSNEYHQQRRHDPNNGYRSSPSQYQGQSSPFTTYHDRTFFNRGRTGFYEQLMLIRGTYVPRLVGTRGANLKHLKSKCHLRDMNVARHPNENGYVECILSAYQTRNLHFAVDTIRNSLRNEDDQAIQIFDSYYVDIPPANDQPQLSAPNQNFEHFQQYTFQNNHYQQPLPPTLSSFTGPSEFHYPPSEAGFMTRPLHFNNSSQLPQPSYNFQNPPSFDFTHQPTSASRKTDKRPGEVNDSNNNNHGSARTPNENPHVQNDASSSSNSSSVSPRHKSKRTCPETKEIDCTTDDGFWIQKQYYHALDDTSKELFDSLLEKLEKIRIANEENAARKQQRLVGRNRPNKSRGHPASISSSSQDKDLAIKIEEPANEDEPKETKEIPSNEEQSTTAV